MNIAGCVGHTPELRQRYVARLQSGIGVFEWLRVSQCDLPSSAVVCAVSGTTVLDVQRRGDTGSLVLGSARRTPATPATGSGDSSVDRFLSGLHGEFFLAFASRDDGSCGATVDSLGLFPLYYYSTAEFFVFASSLWAFGQHQDIPAALDPDGLIGILLSQGIVGGRSLLRGVTRLSAGHAVTWRPGRVAVERPLNRLRPTTAFFDLSLDAQMDAADAAFQLTAADTGADTMLLSGGLDSRLVAGYLSLVRGKDVAAVSLGAAWQYDAAFARAVADSLGWSHRSIDIDQSLFRQHALIQSQHEQAVGSFWDLSFWQLVSDLRGHDPVLATGFCGNNVLEPLRHDPGQTEFTFDRVFELSNRYGLAPEILRRLLRVDHVDERIDAAMQSLRREYDSCDGEPFQKVLAYDLAHRARFLVGAVVWRLSFGARPALPYVRAELLQVALGLPLAAFRNRALQRRLLCRRFPALARLPIDTGTAFTRPLMPSLRDRVRHWGLFAYYLASRRERRYYHSVFDLNGDGWRAVRNEADKSRAQAEAVLDATVLRELLPAADEAIDFEPTRFFQIGSQKKSLLAFLLWAGNHPGSLRPQA